jgi:perosamine synthetase
MHLRTINIALSPNVTWRENLSALGMLFLPWKWGKWRDGEAVSELEKKFSKRFHSDYALSVNSGREALLQILNALKFEPGSEVIMQSFTCMVVTNSIIWAGLKPVFADIDDRYNLDPAELTSKISPKTKAVIVQHTFGIPAQIKEIKTFCEKHKLVLIEDCAHALGASSDGRQLGTFSDVSFFSLGRSKVISCVNGGMIICNKPSIIESLKRQESHLKQNKVSYVAQNLWHPVITTVAKWFYFSIIGKVILVAAQRFKWLNLEVTKPEKVAARPLSFVSRLPNAMAQLALLQLERLDEFNSHRRQASHYYYDKLKVGVAPDPALATGAIFLRYPVLVSNKKHVLLQAKKQGVVLGDWYSSPIAPVDIDNSKTGYLSGSCPKTERLSEKVINLPTYFDLKEKDWEKVINLVNKYAEN